MRQTCMYKEVVIRFDADEVILVYRQMSRGCREHERQTVKVIFTEE